MVPTLILIIKGTHNIRKKVPGVKLKYEVFVRTPLIFKIIRLNPPMCVKNIDFKPQAGKVGYQFRHGYNQ